MNFAVIDTEGSGLFDFSKPADAPGQPRLASLAILLLNDRLEIAAEHVMLVRPEGWEMNPEATAMNGLTTERLTAEGLPVLDVLEMYNRVITAKYAVAAWGAQHDCKTMRAELRLANLPDRFEETPNVCLMRAAMKLKIPKEGKPGGFPKLSDACRFFGIEQPAPHTAGGDARSAHAILRELHHRGILPEPCVHYAKTPPEKKSVENAQKS